MVDRVEEGRINEEKGYIFFVRICGDRLLWRFLGRGSLSDVSEGNAEILGGKEKEERPLTPQGEITGEVQGKYRREVVHVDVSRHITELEI